MTPPCSTALRSPSSARYILNGNFVVSMFKKVFQFGGALVEYSGSDSVIEKVNCTKRLEEDLEIYVSVGGGNDVIFSERAD